MLAGIDLRGDVSVSAKRDRQALAVLTCDVILFNSFAVVQQLSPPNI